MSVQNMWLISTDLNIGSYFSSPKLINSMGEFIPLNEGERCLGIFYMGKHDEIVNQRKPAPIEDKVIWFE